MVFETDRPADQMPLGADQPGRYVLVCNLEGHYLGGMHFVLTVR